MRGRQLPSLISTCASHARSLETNLLLASTSTRRYLASLAKTSGFTKSYANLGSYKRWISSSPVAFASYPEHTIMAMPKLSPTMEVGNIAKWLKKEGEEVTAGNVVADIETDKATVQLEAQEDFILAKILKPEGAQGVAVGDSIAVLVQEKGLVDAFKDFVLAEEAAPKKAKAEEAAPAAPAASASQTPPPPPAAAAAPTPAAKPLPVSAPSSGFQDIEATKYQKVSAARLLQAKQTIPHFYLHAECVIDDMLELRTLWNAKSTEKKPYKLSVNDFVIKAAARACMDVPEVNSQWTEDAIRRFKDVDVSVAVMTPVGLITPIIFQADRKGVIEISNEVKALAALAKDNKLKPEQFIGGTFTISNLGMYGLSDFSAVINPPQSSILAVGTSSPQITTSKDVPEGFFKVSHVMKVTLSCDHRVVDGAVGAQWLNAFKHYVANPTSMIM